MGSHSALDREGGAPERRDRRMLRLPGSDETRAMVAGSWLLGLAREESYQQKRKEILALL